MRLKRVKIYGFKTFADKIEFDLHGNLVAVIGPNGCGKSNLVDAILWGLGEGNARHLRAQNSQDVIFSGSSRRKPVGFAEVTLLFDNEDGALPVQSSEVSVTRRLNRSGDSEYLINRQSCRLRDVLDLLADTGLGRAGYSIVGQKEIDQALAASPEDRRAWVDEAAGVQRYRVRKVEAIKRLSSAQDHLSRVSDILSELEGQREPLREEAEVAIRYKSILASLREVESGLLMVEVAKATREVLGLEEKISSSIRSASAEANIGEMAEEESREATERLRALERELDRAREAKQSSLTSCERAEAAIKLGEQKLATLQELEANLGEEAAIAQRRIEEAESELAGAEAELDSDRDLFAKVRDECAGAGDEAKVLRNRLREADSGLAEARSLHNRRLKQDAERAQIEARVASIRRELEGVEASLPDLVTAVEEANRRHQTSRDAAAKIELEIADANQALADLEREEARDAQEVRKHLAERASLEGKRQGIEATIEAHEGLAQGARAVLDACAKGILTAKYVPVAEALSVKKEHALAIETALGGAVNDLIVEREADAKVAIEHLKANRLGRATFQPLPLMKVSTPSPDLRKALNSGGVLDRACDLIECDAAYRPVFESLLGRVLIVDRLETALRLARTSGWNRLVTLDGEVVHSSGAVSGGVSSKTAYGMIQRKADLAHVAEQVVKLDRLIKGAEKKSGQFAEERTKIAEKMQSSREQMRLAQAELKETGEWLHSVQNEFQTTERSGQKLAHEMETLAAHQFEDVPDCDLAAIEESRDKLVAVLASRSADAEAAAERLRDAQVRVRQAETRLETSQKRLLSAREHEKLRERKVSNLGPERHKSAAEVTQAKVELDRAQSSSNACEAELGRLQASRSSLLLQIERCGEAARSARTSAQAHTDSAHQAELSRARLETRRAASALRLLEEYGFTEEEALLQEPGIELPSDASSVVGRLRRELKAMGDVNIGAVEAYERLTERWDELTSQSEDILGGIREIEAGVRELDKLTRERFLTTFQALQTAFCEIFSRLFAGGEGQIFLADEENILETGVEIDVLLPGKKKQRLELLSGGERSLCAAAFLFSLLKVKPSPLVVLDEVDAPLDGRNVERFIELVQDFAVDTQFILITHNPTTIAAAPVWLGVSMQEPGVSMLIPAHFAATAVVEIREPEGEPVGTG